MSEQNTSEPIAIAPGPKVKDPRRVAAGKRLAAISKQAKEAKRLERESQQNAEINYEQEEEEAGGGGYTTYIVGGLIVVAVASYLLFSNRKKITRTFSGDEEKSDPVQTFNKEDSKSIFDD